MVDSFSAVRSTIQSQVSARPQRPKVRCCVVGDNPAGKALGALHVSEAEPWSKNGREPDRVGLAYDPQARP